MPQAGDVVVVRGRIGDALDRRIMAATNSPYVHTGIAVSGDRLVEAVWPRVRLAPTTNYAREWFTPRYPTDAARDRAVALARTLVGRRYDAPDLLWLDLERFHWPLNAIGRWALKHDLLPWQHYALICSETVGQCLTAGGLVVPTKWGIPVPDDIAHVGGLT